MDLTGRNALDMVRSPLRGYLLLGIEPTVDCIDGGAASKAMDHAQCVVALTAFDIRQNTDADILLPITPFSETPGTYINCEGRAQSMNGAVPPPGAARPAWKVLRVLGNLFALEGFDFIASEQIRDAIDWETPVDLDSESGVKLPAPNSAAKGTGGSELINDVPLYRIDPIVRRANALQITSDNLPAHAYVGTGDAESIGVANGDQVIVRSNGVSVTLTAHIDVGIPTGCVFIPGGYEKTAPLGAALRVEVAKV